MITIFFLRESAKIAYGGEESSAFPDREIVRAQFVAELVETLGYPLSSVCVDAVVWVGRKGFQPVDVLAARDQGDVLVAAAEAPRAYEDRRERAMRDLYIKAEAVSRTTKVSLLVYYTRWHKNGREFTRHVIVDYAAYPTLCAWHAAGSPSLDRLPPY